ncbi:MAG: 1-acyl-sn-glycerol-3-phosphate acyltransferase [Rhizobiales bacterium]|nr:1-acyl-sn-glycerol-3-phosphate acyltransferase [Hyphomicrobiales bacterium]
MSAVRGARRLVLFLAFTLPMMLVQFLALRVSPRLAARIPVWYHRRVAAILGLRVKVTGQLDPDRPALLLSNHISWLDIVVLGSVAPVSFVAKREVGEWPFVSWLARLQQTIFVDRERRTSLPEIAARMGERMAEGGNVVLFPEGTSGDGNRVLAFKSSLIAPVFAEAGGPTDTPRPQVRTCAIAYTRLQGLPIGRAGRPLVAWYGDMDMFTHGWGVLRSPPIEVHVVIDPPLEITEFPDRKTLTAYAEGRVAEQVARLLRTGGVAAGGPKRDARPAAALTGEGHRPALDAPGGGA